MILKYEGVLFTRYSSDKRVPKSVGTILIKDTC